MEREREPTRGAVGAAAFVLMLPVLYVLSSGPFAWLAVHDYVNENMWYVIYAPVAWVYDRAPEPLQHLTEWYIELWLE